MYWARVGLHPPSLRMVDATLQYAAQRKRRTGDVGLHDIYSRPLQVINRYNAFNEGVSSSKPPEQFHCNKSAERMPQAR